MYMCFVVSTVNNPSIMGTVSERLIIQPACSYRILTETPKRSQIGVTKQHATALKERKSRPNQSRNPMNEQESNEIRSYRWSLIVVLIVWPPNSAINSCQATFHRPNLGSRFASETLSKSTFDQRCRSSPFPIRDLPSPIIIFFLCLVFWDDDLDLYVRKRFCV